MVDPDLLEMIARYELKSTYQEVTDEQVETHLMKILITPTERGTPAIDKIMSKLKMDLKIVDPRQRVLEYMTTVERLLAINGLKNTFSSTKEQKKRLVRYVTAGVRPSCVRDRVQEEMSKATEEKQNLDHLYVVIRDEVIMQDRYHDRKDKVVPWYKIDNVEEHRQEVMNERVAKAIFSTPVKRCFKCKSTDHTIKDCVYRTARRSTFKQKFNRSTAGSTSQGRVLGRRDPKGYESNDSNAKKSVE
jgi:hypothetical protein